LAFAAGATVLAPGAPADPQRLFLLTAFVCVGDAFARGAIQQLPGPFAERLNHAVAGFVPVAFAPAVLWQFALEFPRVLRFTTFDVLARRAAALAWMVGFLLFAVNIAARDAHPALMLRRDHPGNTFWDLFAIAMLPALLAILVRSRRASGAERRRVMRFGAALAGGSMPFLACGILRLLAPPLDRWFATAASPWRGLVDALLLGPLAATPILVSATLVLDRPFARTGQSAAHGWSWTAWINAPTLLVRRMWTPIDGWRRRDSSPRACDQEWILGVLERVRSVDNAAHVAYVLAEEIAAGLNCTVRILHGSGDGSFRDASGHAPVLMPDTGLPFILRQTRTPLDVSTDAIRLLLPHSGRDWVRRSEVKLLTALRDDDGRIAAMLAFSDLQDSRPLTRQEYWVVAALVAAVGCRIRHIGAASERGSHALHSEAALECIRCGTIAGPGPGGRACGCEQPLVPAALPRRLGSNVVVRQRIGAGGMGLVYRAHDVVLGRDVALKTVPGLRGREVDRLHEEARTMAALNHEALATLFGIERWRGTPVLVEEFFPHGTLAIRLASGPFSVPDAFDLAMRLTRALIYMHARGLVHGDVKPGNIGMTMEGRPKLLDFGLTTLVGSPAGTTGGTAAYLPPEVLRGNVPSNISIDLWGVSLTLLEALIGRHPIACEGERHTNRGIEDAIKCLVDAGHSGARADAFFRRALSKAPDRRFATATELESALTALARRSSPSHMGCCSGY
jgi:hypothetical protein